MPEETKETPIDVATEKVEATETTDDADLNPKRNADEEQITTEAEAPPKKRRRRNYDDDVPKEEEAAANKGDDDDEEDDEDDEKYEHAQDEEDEEEEDDLEIDESNIITTGRRTRGKVIDFKEAAKKLDADAEKAGTSIREEGEGDEEDDEDEEEPDYKE